MDSSKSSPAGRNPATPEWRGLAPGTLLAGRLGPASALRQVTVLIADDEPIVRMVLEDMLLKLGYFVLSAADGLQALELFQQYGDVVDLLIFDLSMPNMDGEELFSEIRRLSPATKTIMITGYNEVVSLDHLRSQGLCGFIAKPFGVEEIKSEVGRVLDA